MKTKVKIISTAFLFIFAMTSYLFAQNQLESTEKTFKVEPVDLNVKIMSKLLKRGEGATVRCDHYSVVIKCAFACPQCGCWLEAIGADAYGNPSHPKGICPACGFKLDGTILK